MCHAIRIYEVPGLNVPENRPQATLEPLRSDTERFFMNYSPAEVIKKLDV